MFGKGRNEEGEHESGKLRKRQELELYFNPIIRFIRLSKFIRLSIIRINPFIRQYYPSLSGLSENIIRFIRNLSEVYPKFIRSLSELIRKFVFFIRAYPSLSDFIQLYPKAYPKVAVFCVFFMFFLLFIRIYPTLPDVFFAFYPDFIRCYPKTLIRRLCFIYSISRTPTGSYT